MEEQIITKADLIARPNKALEEAKKEPNGMKRYRKVLETSKKNNQWYAEHANGNLYVQDYTGVNPVIGNINSAQGAGTKIK